jgi:Fe-S-cluster containining protein
MERLEAELDRARDLEVDALANAIETIGFECTRCGACCTAEAACGDGADSEAPHTATVFPDEVRTLLDSDDTPAAYDWRDVARPMPYGLEAAADGTPEGETFEWALQTDDCGDCTFYERAGERADAAVGRCTVHSDRPRICRTYPFSVALAGTSQPMGEAVDEAGLVRAHECQGLGRDIDRAAAEGLATALQERAVRELEEAIAVRDRYEPVGAEGVVVHDSEGPKRPDGRPVDGDG